MDRDFRVLYAQDSSLCFCVFLDLHTDTIITNTKIAKENKC